jgi:predicted Fe-S protein YdhL (DUF1289 family)
LKSSSKVHQNEATCVASFFYPERKDIPLAATNASSAAADPVDSPCIGVCTLSDNGLCMGCFRSMDEISNWTRFTHVDKRRIMAEIPGRLAAMFST